MNERKPDPKNRGAAQVGMPAWLYLNVWAELVSDAFDATPYLVGSATTRKDFRDVDVRVILPDRRFRQVFPMHKGMKGHHPLPLGTRWAAVCMAFAALGKQMTGLPIDFQVQSQTQANTEPGAASRVPLGMRVEGRKHE